MRVMMFVETEILSCIRLILWTYETMHLTATTVVHIADCEYEE